MDFGRWLANQKPLPSPEAEPELPPGVWEAGPGVYQARCRSCGREYELVYDPQEFTEAGNYCSGSDRCLP